MKKIKISVYWPDDTKSVILTQKEYQSILDGNSLDKDGEGYCYLPAYFSKSSGGNFEIPDLKSTRTLSMST